MKVWGALVVAAVAGCAAPRVERLVRPHRVETRGSTEGMRMAVTGLELPFREPVAVPPLVTRFDLSTLAPSLPPAPQTTPLARPRSGGDALRLADRALELGDALDAAAQYRPLLAAARPSDAPYIQFQLARALLAQGQRGEATGLLWTVAHGQGPEAWPALLLLADVRTHDAGVHRSLAELRRIAGERLTLIEMHLIHVAGPGDAAILLLSAADRTEMRGVACGYVLAAVDRIGADRLPSDVRLGRCRNEIDAYLGLPPVRDTIFEDAAARWDDALARTDRGELEPDAWLDAARIYAQAQHHVRSRDELLQMRWNTYGAWLNAVVVAVRRGDIDDHFLREASALYDDLQPTYSMESKRILDGLHYHAAIRR